MADKKVVAGGVGVAAAVGIGLALALSGPAKIDPSKVKISDPAARAAFLKIKNPTPADVRRFEDSHTP